MGGTNSLSGDALDLAERSSALNLGCRRDGQFIHFQLPVPRDGYILSLTTYYLTLKLQRIKSMV
jgi:hypothetical protein